MIYEDKVDVIIKQRVSDGMGGYTEENVHACTIYCKVAPYKVSERDVANALNPWSSISFYTEDTITNTDGEPLDEDDEFFLEYKGKMYRKTATVDYSKCIKIVGERYHL